MSPSATIFYKRMRERNRTGRYHLMPGHSRYLQRHYAKLVVGFWWARYNHLDTRQDHALFWRMWGRTVNGRKAVPGKEPAHLLLSTLARRRAA